MRKKLLSLLLAALMILGLLPAAALAAEGDAAPAAPAAPAAEDIAVQADEETVTLPVEADDSGSGSAERHGGCNGELGVAGNTRRCCMPLRCMHGIS